MRLINFEKFSNLSSVFVEKYIIFGDFHLRKNKPISRIDDDWYQTQFLKLFEIAKVANIVNCNILISLGDLFDKYNPDLKLINDFIDWAKKYKFHIYTILGNHDVEGRNLVTYRNAALGILEKSSILTVIKSYVETDKCIFSAYHFSDSLDNKFYSKLDRSDKYKIVLIHRMVSKEKLVFDSIIADSIETDADIIFSAHNHIPFINTNPLIINVGSVLRINRTELHKPKIYLLGINDDIYVSYYVLDHIPNPFIEVIDSDRHIDIKEFKEHISKFSNVVINFPMYLNQIMEKIDIPDKEEVVKILLEKYEKYKHL